MIYTVNFLRFILLLIFSTNLVNAKDLTRQSPIEKTVLLKGIKGSHHYFEPNELIFNTGKLYKLIIKNISDSKHYFKSDQFADSIFTRKIQLTINNEKVSEVKGIIKQIELWPGYQVEWWFVPIKTGIFADLHCNVKDSNTQKKHKEMGMNGTIIIK